MSAASTCERYKLMPHQHVGAYRVGFMPQRIAREYLARRGSVRFRPEQLSASRCSLLGHSPESLKIDGNCCMDCGSVEDYAPLLPSG